MQTNRRRRSFTIIEILIAIVVLVLGITGIVALFPTAIESGNQTVEDTYAATITQSVVDAISVGIRESRYSYRGPASNRVWTYFLLNHDGVLDGPVTTPEDYTEATGKLWARDFCVVLPQAGVDDNADTSKEPTFVFPTPALPAQIEGFRTGGEPSPTYPYLDLFARNPSALDAASPADFTNLDGFSASFQGRTASDGTPVLWFPRTYPLGRYRQGDPGVVDTDVGKIRPEFRGENISTGGTGPGEETIAVDPYPNYSFVFTIKRARLDTHGGAGATPAPDGRITVADRFSNSLFELKVYVFKNFNPQLSTELAMPATASRPPVPRGNRHVREFITLISL